MKKLISNAVKIAYDALGDLVEDCVVEIPKSGNFSWSSNSPDISTSTHSARAVLVDEKMKHSREGAKQRWAIVEFDSMPEQFTKLTIAGRKYTCGAPLASYKFVFLVEVYEVL